MIKKLVKIIRFSFFVFLIFLAVPLWSKTFADYDVLLYDDTTAGISALKALSTTSQSLGKNMTVLWLRNSPTFRKAMAENGVSIEDLFYGNLYESGNLQAFRIGIDNYYNNPARTIGLAPYILNSQRQSFVPDAAKAAFNSMLLNLPSLTVTQAYGYPTFAIYDSAADMATITVNTLSTYRAKYFIDSSIEGDLARVLGADYRLGMNENLFNDQSLGGKTPITYSDVDPCTLNGGTNCGPEAFGMPIILNESLDASNSATLSAGLYTFGDITVNYTPGVFQSNYINPLTGTNYNYDYLKAQFDGGACNIAHMVDTPLPRKGGATLVYTDKLYEFNQGWNDYRIDQAIFDWFIHPENRVSIRREVAEIELHAVNYLQTACGKPQYSPAVYQANIYPRGEMRISGLGYMITTGQKNDSIAIGNYNPYDRHLADNQGTATNVNLNYGIEVPYNTMLPSSDSALFSPVIANLIFPSAVSTDYKTFNTSVRMEATRMYLGEAAGTAAALAKNYEVKIKNIKSNDVQAQLRKRNVMVFIYNVAARNLNINESPYAVSFSPVSGVSYQYKRNLIVKLSVIAKDNNLDQVQTQFKLVKNGNCTTATTTSLSVLGSSGSTQAYGFKNLAKGSYTWAARVKDSRGAYSIGNDFCGNDGWSPVSAFTIN